MGRDQFRHDFGNLQDWFYWFSRGLNWTAKERAGKPVVGIYCATFLTRDMRHVYRQVVHLREVAQYVVTQKRRNVPQQLPEGFETILAQRIGDQ